MLTKIERISGRKVVGGSSPLTPTNMLIENLISYTMQDRVVVTQQSHDLLGRFDSGSCYQFDTQNM